MHLPKHSNRQTQNLSPQTGTLNPKRVSPSAWTQVKEKDLKDSEKVLGRKTNVFGFFKKVNVLGKSMVLKEVCGLGRA